jgi:hypothetical protein
LPPLFALIAGIRSGPACVKDFFLLPHRTTLHSLMLLNDGTDRQQVATATPLPPSPPSSEAASVAAARAAEDGVALTETPTLSEVLPSNRFSLLRHLRPPTGISTPSSSLDSCLAAFPLQPGMPSFQDSSSSTAPPPPPPPTGKAMPPPPIVTCSPLQSSTLSTSNANSPLLSSLVDMSECSTLNESAVASSDDAMCSSPLLAEIKDRRFSAKREPMPKDSLHSHPSLSYIRALGHWQEQAFPPVPAIPAQFQESSSQSVGWTRCADVDGASTTCSIDPSGESTKGESICGRSYNRQSIISSSRIASDPACNTSEYSLDTCANSINTCTSPTSKRDSIGAGLLKVHGPNDKKRAPSSLARDSQGPFAFNVNDNDSSLSLESLKSRGVSRGTCRPDTATKRIAFAPSVRIGTSTPSKDFTSRKTNHLRNIGSLLDDMRNGAGDRTIPESPPPPPPPKEEVRLLTATGKKSFLPRPSTAPHPNRKAAAENAFRKLLRPISRHNNRDKEDSFPNFSRPKTAKSKIDESDSVSVESRQSFHAPLHLDGPFGRSQPSNMASAVEATRVEELPRPPRAFYPGTLILVKDEGKEEQHSVSDRTFKTPAGSYKLEVEQQERGGCPSYSDAVAEDAARLEGSRTPVGKNNVVWSGEPMEVKSDKKGGLKKLKRAVNKVSEAFSARLTTDKTVESMGDTTARPKSRAASSRPSTAPSVAAAGSAPRWGSNSLGKVAKIVSRYEQASQPSILVGPTHRERDNIDALRNLEELKKRNTPWDSQPNQVVASSDRLGPPHYPRSQKRDSQTRIQQSQQQQHLERASAATTASAQPSIQHPYRIALIPVPRVSQDQLKRMQPVKIVKYPVVDTPAM